ncbi:MAG TPA: DUF1848 family protein [Chitinivibrionales bacterium]|jgi:hypothetical protein|nr:DUF1848 family protein [Chitinivibrionales bacterium]
MSFHQPYYISCSRRTDVPRFFLNEFFDAWQKGEITYHAGYGRSYTLSLKPADVLGYIFWSKDFAAFINHALFDELLKKNNAIFHYTINDCPDLEPNVAPLNKRLETLTRLCALVGPERVMWRFDPICKYKKKDCGIVTNFSSFFDILPYVEKAGVKCCYFSFMSHYSKLKKRDVLFDNFDEQERTVLGKELLDATSKAGMKLYNCCNPEVLRLVPGILQAHCIDNELLRETDRFGVHPRLSLKPTREGCGCFESRDVGSYLQKCLHRCRYCYANPG